MREATQVVNTNPAINNIADKASCQPGTPKGMRIIIAIGEVKGITESQKDRLLSGLFTTTFIPKIKVKIKGKVMGSINCCVSVSLSTAEPTAAKSALYNKYPPMK